VKRTTHRSERSAGRGEREGDCSDRPRAETSVAEHEATVTARELEIKARRTIIDETPAALLTLDTIARGGLSKASFRRYLAYKQSLLRSDQDVQSTAVALSLFVWDLLRGSTSTTLH
jgi:hypothetical protein